jgi:curved DNA-binding protein CbpA
MGNGQSLQLYNQSHVKIYRDLLRIQNARTRAEMIRTLLAGQEYIAAARNAGVYSHLLAYIARVDTGQYPAALPGEMAMSAVTARAALPLGAMSAVAVKQTAALPPPQYAPPPTSTAMSIYGNTLAAPQVQQRPAAHVAKGRRNEKALTYFQSCLEVLGLEEEVALTEDALKKAYKKAAIKAHPDKGGTEEDFEAITRAHAYLGEILRRIQGGRTKEGVVEAPTALKDHRTADAKKWEMVEPVRLNPKKLDLNAFNQMFEQTRIPDPEDEGYGDWLKDPSAGDGGAGGQKFSGKFNRDVFNRMFEEEAAKKGRGTQGNELALRQPEALTLAPTYGVELGRGRPETYTAAANASLKFTDLKSAYTQENMITNQVADVRVEARSFDKYQAQWKQAPAPLAAGEMAAVAAAEDAMKQREAQRRLRAAQEDSMAEQYFNRMKTLVITNK